jgi:hypothetical protein
MPNTLAHIGIQGFTTRPFLTNKDIKWIYLGCIIPDIPWILQRIVKFAGMGVNPYNLRLYAVVQSSLLLCVILSFAIAMFSIYYWKTFVILSINSLLHLLLDACQIKWANGVQLFAPFSWKLTNFGFFWPESIPTYLLTAIGLLFFILVWKKAISGELDLKFNSSLRSIGFILLLVVYLISPLFLLNKSEKQDNHFVHTLRNYEDREGKYVELDRKAYDSTTKKISLFSNEEINAKGIELNKSKILSVKGTFIGPDTILVSEYHVHNDLLRDGASYVGLSLILILWVVTFINHNRKKE